MRTKHVNGPRANQAGLNDDSVVVTVFPRNKNNNNRNKENTQKRREKKYRCAIGWNEPTAKKKRHYIYAQI